MVLGVCGKIASGKSEVLKLLEKRGFYCIYADKIVHDLYRSGGVGAKKVAAVFGVKFLKQNGEVDRLKLRTKIYADEDKLSLLNDIIHPLVYEEVASILKKLGKEKNVAIEAVYFDNEFLGDFVDKLLWVERDESYIIEVLQAERGFNADLARKAVNYVQKNRDSDLVLVNNGSLQDLSRNLNKILLESGYGI